VHAVRNAFKRFLVSFTDSGKLVYKEKIEEMCTRTFHLPSLTRTSPRGATACYPLSAVSMCRAGDTRTTTRALQLSDLTPPRLPGSGTQHFRARLCIQERQLSP
jgi:hypothetical protein